MVPPSPPTWLTPAAAAAALAILWALEGAAPLFTGRAARSAHGVRNLAVGAIAAGARALVFPAVLLWATAAAAEHRLGLLHLLDWPWWAGLVLAIVLLDGWHYAWHLISHKTPFLWRFHAVHHHDEAVDATTAFRFHAGDILLASLAVVAAVPILGLGIGHILSYELLMVPVSVFHHANIRIPERVDHVLRIVLVTPRMHFVHHSRWQPETDSNYSSIFSFWDRLFGTLRLRRDPRTLELGLDGYERRDHATLLGILATPIGPIKSTPGTPPAPEEAEPQPRPIPGRHAARTLRPCPAPTPLREPRPAAG